MIRRNGESYGNFNTLEEALYERDRLIRVDWNIDKWVELPETINGYIHIDLPPFHHKAEYVVLDREHWTVRGKGREYRYYGTYYSEEEAKQVCKIYDGRIIHYGERYRVQKRINNKNKTFGYYETREEAMERVLELEENGWKK